MRTLELTQEELEYLEELVEAEEEYAIFKDRDTSFFISLLAAFARVLAQEEMK